MVIPGSTTTTTLVLSHKVFTNTSSVPPSPSLLFVDGSSDSPPLSPDPSSPEDAPTNSHCYLDRIRHSLAQYALSISFTYSPDFQNFFITIHSHSEWLSYREDVQHPSGSKL